MRGGALQRPVKSFTFGRALSRCRNHRVKEYVWEPVLFVRARLQPCRNRSSMSAASAAEVANFEFSDRFFRPPLFSRTYLICT
jgi:hypothetical protein